MTGGIVHLGMLAVEWPLVRASIASDNTSNESTDSSSSCSSSYSPTSSSNVFESLERAKASVPGMIESHGKRRWVFLVNKHAPVVSKHACSRAYGKLDELFRTCALPTPTCSLHLCESPGGFVQATGDFVKRSGGGEEWKWLALSLPSSSPMVPTPSRDALPMHQGSFLECDVYDPPWERLPNAAADLVTADGAIEMDHTSLEVEHLPLLWAQTQVAIRCLKPGGNMIIKFFDGRLSTTRRWIAVMSTLFQQTSVIKPNASRPTNSERYLVCRTFQPSDLENGDTPLNSYRPSQAWDTETYRVMERMAMVQLEALNTTFAQLNTKQEFPSASTSR